LKALDARECLLAAVALARANAPGAPVSVLETSSFVRRRRLIDVHEEALARAGRLKGLVEQGTRTLLLAAWAKSLGLTADPRRVAVFERQLMRQVVDPSERLRLATVLALEERVLDSPERMLPDGPSRLEGVYLQAVREGLFRSRR
jgi:hypothetical protein